MVHWIYTATNQNFANTIVGARPRSAYFTKDDSKLWVSAEIGGTVHVFDVKTQTELKQINFSIKGIHKDRIQPVGIVLLKEAPYAFVALGPANHVAVINTDTYEVEDYILVGRRVWQLGFDANESRLLTTNGVSSDVSVIDTQSHKVIKTIKVGRFPWGVAVK